MTTVTSYIPQSFKTDPLFVSDYFVCLPIYLFGILFNGIILGTMVKYQEALIKERIDRITSLLVGIYFAWSIIFAAKYILWLFYASETFYRISAALTSQVMILVFGTNMMMAFERYCLVKSIEPEREMRYLQITIVFMGSLCGIILAVFASSPSLDTVSPEYPLQAKVWLLTVAVAFMVFTSGTVYLYTTTYQYSSRFLKQMESKHVALVPLGTERRVFCYCVVMSSTLLVLYTPELLLNVADAFDVALLSESVHLVWDHFAHAAVAVDVLVAPGLVLFFNQPIRAYGKMLLGFKEDLEN
ncbi:hypothetical protein HDU80_010601 [Chytriomyces hyalinus]|nr:hypothetical protein HDU80_010601 [Chytriomyces hyalinus]